MGQVVAYVHCRCFREGRTAPLPAGIEAWVDHCGEIRPVDDDRKTWRLFEQWEDASPCAHVEFTVRKEALAPWQIELLRAEILERHEVFPVLARYLPGPDWDCLPADLLREARAEVDRFAELVTSTQSKTLVDSSTDVVVCEANPYSGALPLVGDFAIQGDKFAVGPKDPSGPTLLARHLEQRIIGLTPDIQALGAKESVVLASGTIPASRLLVSDYKHVNRLKFNLRDLDSPTEVEVGRGVNHWVFTENNRFDYYPERFHVEVSPRPTIAFADELAALARIFAVAIEEGSAVNWFK